MTFHAVVNAPQGEKLPGGLAKDTLLHAVQAQKMPSCLILFRLYMWSCEAKVP